MKTKFGAMIHMELGIQQQKIPTEDKEALDGEIRASQIPGLLGECAAINAYSTAAKLLGLCGESLDLCADLGITLV